MKNWKSYSLRTLLIAVTLLAVALGLYVRWRHFRRLAAEHHLAAMEAGYEAASIQRPVDLEWEWKFPSSIRYDRATILKAAPHWQRSRYESQLRDRYLSAASQPWLPLLAIPQPPAPVGVPEDNDKLEAWWQREFGPYADANPCLLESYMVFGPGDRNLQLMQELLTPAQNARLIIRFQQLRGPPSTVANSPK